MCPMVIDSTDDEVDPAPIKSSSGQVVKPSAVLLDPSNVAKVPGQPNISTKGQVTLSKNHRRTRNKSTCQKIQGASQVVKEKKRDVAIEDVPDTDVPDLPPTTLIHDEAHPEGWLKDLDGIEDLPEAGAKKNKERTVDIQFFLTICVSKWGKR
ncbi:hypothetical protein JB92DRAFT_3101099 [Gautieria morchelliformis]|nr:hypothetical protein JB92DRAFT_3101099 [Gautieria morchelliformis]